MEFLLDKIKATKGNAEFFDSMRRGRIGPRGPPTAPASTQYVRNK